MDEVEGEDLKEGALWWGCQLPRPRAWCRGRVRGREMRLTVTFATATLRATRDNAALL